MCVGGGTTNNDQLTSDLGKFRKGHYAKAREAAEKDLYVQAATNDVEREERKKKATQMYIDSIEGNAKSQMGDDYTDPTTGLRKGQIVASDYTDDALKKARTSAWNRLQMGKTQKSSFATSGKLGGFDVAKPVLGGY